MKMKLKFGIGWGMVLGLGLIVSWGCATSARSQGAASMQQAPPGTPGPPFPPPPSIQAASGLLDPIATAGVPVPEGIDSNFQRMKALARRSNLGGRTDPFALLPAEARYDREQAGARILNELGGFVNYYEPPEEVQDESEIIDPQPPRRVSGIVLGEAVYAILHMGPGAPGIVVRPGTRIQEGPTTWTVVSIDEDKVVLRRDGNRRPNMVVVRLSGTLQLPGGGG